MCPSAIMLGGCGVGRCVHACCDECTSKSACLPMPTKPSTSAHLASLCCPHRIVPVCQHDDHAACGPLLHRAKSGAGAASSASVEQQQQPEQQQWDPTTAGVTHAIGIGCGKQDNLRKVWQRQQQQQAGAAEGARDKQQRAPRISNECEVRPTVLACSGSNTRSALKQQC